MGGVADDRPPPPQPPADDETARFDQPIDQPPDETAVMPAAGERPAGEQPAGEQPAGEQPARWAARAGVPAAGPRPSEPQWVPDQQPRTWWAPILIGVAILVLVGLIALGLWVAVRSKPGTPTSPSPTPSSPAPSSASPSPAPSPTASTSPPVTMVVVPSLRGVSLSDAEQILQSQGLNWTVSTRVSSEFAAGTVIESNPPPESGVAAG